MADFSFPAHLAVDETVDGDGLPILSATLTPAPEATDLPLPAGPAGPAGPRGTARAPFRKMGTIANVGARPVGLGAEDRGKWWHRLDNGSMDTWDGTTWRNSPGAVGPTGPAGPGASIAATTTHEATLTVPAVRVTADGPALTLAVTAPAGDRGPTGPAGASGSISTATDFDQAIGPGKRGVFLWSAAAKKFRVASAPNGFGVWSWYGNDFNADAEQAATRLIAGTFAIPAMPYAWRPMVWGRLQIFCQAGLQSDGEIRVRIGTETGPMVGAGAGIRADGGYYTNVFGPAIGDTAPKPIGPTSTLASVAAHVETVLYVTVERIGQGTSATLGYKRTGASLTVWAQPIQ